MCKWRYAGKKEVARGTHVVRSLSAHSEAPFWPVFYHHGFRTWTPRPAIYFQSNISAPSSSAIAWLPRKVLNDFWSTLARKLTMAETFRSRPKKAPRARGQVQFVMWHFHFSISSMTVPGTCLRDRTLSRIHWSALYPKMSYTVPWLGNVGWIYYRPPRGGTARGFIKAGKCESSPLRVQATGGQIITEEIMDGSRPQHPALGRSKLLKDDKINKSAFRVQINISLIS